MCYKMRYEEVRLLILFFSFILVNFRRDGLVVLKGGFFYLFIMIKF